MKLKKNFDVIEFLKNNLVPIMFIIICAIWALTGESSMPTVSISSPVRDSPSSLI